MTGTPQEKIELLDIKVPNQITLEKLEKTFEKELGTKGTRVVQNLCMGTGGDGTPFPIYSWSVALSCTLYIYGCRSEIEKILAQDDFKDCTIVNHPTENQKLTVL